VSLTLRSPEVSRLGASEAARHFSGRLAEIAAERDGYNRLYARGRLSDAEYDRYVADLDAEKTVAERELAKLREASTRLEELEERKALILTWFGTGLTLGLAYFPSVLRRATYGLLGLRASVEPGGRVSIEGVLDAGVVRLGRDVEEYVTTLEEAGSRPPVGDSALTIAERFEEVRRLIESGE
jgi:hypothetical protein